MVSSEQKTLRFGLLHYHLQRGGVCTVLVNTLRALIAYGGYNLLEIDLISSDARQSHAQELADELRQWARRHNGTNLHLRQIEIPSLTYDSSSARDRKQLFQQAEKIADYILDAMDLSRSTATCPYVLNVHNGNLGKNPRLTLALKLLVARLDRDNLPAWLLYQMHDFAEDKRPQCWKALRDSSGKKDVALALEMMYPVSSRIRWVTINSSDQQCLLSMGMPSQLVEILPNAIDVESFVRLNDKSLSNGDLEEYSSLSPPQVRDLKERLASYAQCQGYVFDPEREILLSPVKAIRRKNIVESILLLLALNARDDRFQLIISLPASSSDDVAYGTRIENFVKKFQLPVVIGPGKLLFRGGHKRIVNNGIIECYSIIDLIELSSAILTTSIQEGFGYVFHEPWLVGKAVLGRNIPHVTADFKAQAMKLGHLYDHLLIPLDWLQNRWPQIRQRYVNKIISLHQALNIPVISPISLIEHIERRKIFRTDANNPAFSRLYLDWADLDIETQLSLLEKVTASPSVINEMTWADSQNREISNWFCPQNSDIIKYNKSIVSTKYNLQAKAENLTGMIRKGHQSYQNGIHTKIQITNEPIFARALAIESMRLLD